jgi:hypothetical protein
MAAPCCFVAVRRRAILVLAESERPEIRLAGCMRFWIIDHGGNVGKHLRHESGALQRVFGDDFSCRVRAQERDHLRLRPVSL